MDRSKRNSFSHDISSVYASKIYKQYGNQAISVVQANPYRLAHDIFGIGFLTADKIAQKLDFDKKSILRVEAGIMFIMHEITTEGHVYYSIDEVISKSKEMLNVDGDVISTALETLLLEKKIAIENLVTKDNTVRGIFLGGYHIAEKQIAILLKDLNDNKSNIPDIDSDTYINFAQNKLSITLAEKQKEALKSAIINKITIITGGPGTGKTTITKVILEIISKTTDKILLAAPTGRAAKRMSEATGKIAKTIHRLLEFSPIDGKFKKMKNFLSTVVS